jgi:alkanesulfonate monooxygenase SsuD/methylene tetrahydromethanopterin reductase-like flavin-dependent oxidoreductase (luciferase family)
LRINWGLGQSAAASVACVHPTVQRGVYVAPFDELVEPQTLTELAASAEAHGWDGFFVWDHVRYRPPVRAVADPWVALAPVGAATERIRIGPLVTPLSRRRVHKLARETVTLDHFSGGCHRHRRLQAIPAAGEVSAAGR